MPSKSSHRYILAAVVAAALVGSVQVNAKDPSELDDLEIAHVAHTAGNIDIRYAHLALALSSNPAVRNFAATMIRDHSAVNTEALALVEELGVQPKDNPVSQQLVAQADALVDELRVLDGKAFDRRYASNELGYHQFVNGAVEDVFIPNAENAKLKGLLASALKVFKIHEGHAAAMVEALD